MAADDLTRSAGSSRGSWGFRVSGSFRELWSDPSDVFDSRRHDENDEADLRLAALVRLPGSRGEIVPQNSVDGEAVDDATFGSLDKKIHIGRVLQVVEEENERLLRGLRKRMDRLTSLSTINRHERV